MDSSVRLRRSRRHVGEFVGRAADVMRRCRWRHRDDGGSNPGSPGRTGNPGEEQVPALTPRLFAATLDSRAVTNVPAGAARRLVATAARLLDGDAAPTGPGGSSRHQHLTVLAAAYAVTGEERYARRVAEALVSWWAANPPPREGQQIRGLEGGIPLVSWVWVRRLLEGWPEAPGLFEGNANALGHIWWRQRLLATSGGSRPSPVDSHAVAEAAGLLVAACAFDWFPESPQWRTLSLRALDERLRRSTAPSGLHRTPGHHGLVLDLGLAGALEADACGVAVPGSTWLVLSRMTDALAAVVDSRVRPPWRNAADAGRGLVLDGDGTDRWMSLLHTGAILFGQQPWWPELPDEDIRTSLLSSLARSPRAAVARPAERPVDFTDAGLAVLRSDGSGGEVWCRCDGGSGDGTSSPAPADSLSVEVRHDGVDILSGLRGDPGNDALSHHATAHPTVGRNTLHLDDIDQSTSDGRFHLTRRARSRIVGVSATGQGITRWCAERDAGSPGAGSVVHRRLVALDEAELRIYDELSGWGRHRCRLTFHLGPSVSACLTGHTARLTWQSHGRHHGAVLTLPRQLSWTLHRGSTEPSSRCSSGFDGHEPADTLRGTGHLTAGPVLVTVLQFGA